MSFLAEALPVALQAGATIFGAKKSSDAAKDAAKAAKKAQVDPQQIADMARQQAQANLAASLALEQQYAPENAALRTQTAQNLLSQIGGGDRYGDLALSTVAQQLAAPQPQLQQSPLLQQAVARAGQELALGGQLPIDVQNEITRRSISQAGRVGGGTTGTARYIAPRDLGINSLQLLQSRLGTASQLGGQEQAANQSAFDALLQNLAVRANLAGQMGNLATQQAGRYLGQAQFGQSLTPPVAGLDPGDFASLFVANQNAATAAAQQAAQLKAQTGANTANMIGSLAGMTKDIDWASIFNRKPATPAATPAATPTGDSYPYI